MNNVKNIASYIIDYCQDKNCDISNLKLQKLLYFVWIDYYKHKKQKLFGENFFAWKFGPVVPEIYERYCVYGGMPITDIEQEYCHVEDCDKEIINETLDKKAHLNVNKLIELTHSDSGAWFETYQKYGYKKIIPFDTIIEKECRDDIQPTSSDSEEN